MCILQNSFFQNITNLGSGVPSALQLRVRGSFLGTIWDIGCSDMCGGLTESPGERTVRWWQANYWGLHEPGLRQCVVNIVSIFRHFTSQLHYKANCEEEKHPSSPRSQQRVCPTLPQCLHFAGNWWVVFWLRQGMGLVYSDTSYSFPPRLCVSQCIVWHSPVTAWPHDRWLSCLG